MTKTIVSFITCVLLYKFYDASFIRSRTFVADTALNGYKCHEDNIIFYKTGNAIACAINCMDDIACKSMVFYQETRQCIGCSSFEGVNGQNSSKFYIRGHEYIGCYYDQPRILSGSTVRNTSMTTQFCLNFCLSGGYEYTMTQYGKDCICDHTAEIAQLQAQKRQESECDYTCAGDANQICGGFYIGSLYRTGL
ncbi:WSC domain-containing protein 2-like [Mercenaria mercenaria]|uniref:WSC domain-containing protein 2-like n=1 Tax=Mercenaria mercenaria TaxID=6596 RepID=UPI00234EB9DB|nr:WSC domain-containing protein 2-like [Mercenaria mercenaria]